MAPHPNQKPPGVTRKRVYDYWCDHWLRYGYAPTMREAEAALGINKNVIGYHVRNLESAGLLEYDTSMSVRQYRIARYEPRQEKRSA